MKITVTVFRNIRNNKMTELFTWPVSRMLYDDSRILWPKLRILAAKLSANGKPGTHKLEYMEYLDSGVIYKYSISDQLPNVAPMETAELEYNPILGARACHNCAHEKIWNGHLICLHRGNLTDGICLDWTEPESKPQRIRRTRRTNVYNRG